jgi:hypothetical protein
MFHVVLAQADLPFLVFLHRTVGWYVVALLGMVGIWGVVLGVLRRDPGRSFWIGTGVAFAAGVLQVAMGLVGFAVEERDPGNQHLFYGVVMMFAFSFAYMYRSQFSRRPALSYGLLLLFCMGLGIRGIMTFGQSFGA